MAGDEHQAQQVVADVVVERVLGGAVGQPRPLVELARQLVVLAIEPGAAAQQIDGPVLGRLHQPGARVARHAGRRPLLEGRDQRVVRQVLGRADIAHQAHQPGNQLRRLEAPHRLDGGMGVGCHAVGPDPAAGAKSSASKTCRISTYPPS